MPDTAPDPNTYYGTRTVADVAHELCRPCVVMRPSLSIDGNKWCALYGDSLQDGVAGFGSSPFEACWNFDIAWHTKLQSLPV